MGLIFLSIRFQDIKIMKNMAKFIHRARFGTGSLRYRCHEVEVSTCSWLGKGVMRFVGVAVSPRTSRSTFGAF